MSEEHTKSGENRDSKKPGARIPGAEATRRMPTAPPTPASPGRASSTSDDETLEIGASDERTRIPDTSAERRAVEQEQAADGATRQRDVSPRVAPTEVRDREDSNIADGDTRARSEQQTAHLDADTTSLLEEKMAAVETDESGKHPKQIGHYRIERVLGSGGFGVVYLAAQEKPIKRKVALKLLKLGMDSEVVLARFRAEQQAMAIMSHPYIAQVYDSGVTERGQSFFVMEYIDGVPLHEFCDKNNLSTRERLALFKQILEGIQHAHQKGIIHRDLKPGNVMVTVHEGKPIPKLIDFGIAKAVNPDLETSFQTQAGMVVGTPAYMSPEQVEGDSSALDTRSDIYALGVMLYELLAGAPPFDTQELMQEAMLRLIWKIKEEEPSRPSAKLVSLGDTSTEIAKKRRTDTVGLAKQLRGDLDWIILKALEKKPDRRYPTASEFAADIDRHMNNLPVEAGPPSGVYRLKKFVRRHRAAVTAAVIVMAAFVLGFAGVTYGFLKASQAATKATAVNEFLSDMLASPNPEVDGRDVMVIDILDAAEARLGEGLSGEPEIEATVRHTLGVTYKALGVYDKSIEHFQRALEMRSDLLGPRNPETLATQMGVANTLKDQGKYKEAEELFKRTLEARRSALGEDHVDTIRTLDSLAIVYDRSGRYGEAEALAREALEKMRRVLGPEHPDTLAAVINLSVALCHQGKFEEGLKLFREGLDKQKEVFGREHPVTLYTTLNMANVLVEIGDLADAESLMSESLDIQREVLGADHPRTLQTMSNLASLYADMGLADEAESLFRETLERQTAVLGKSHPETVLTNLSLAYLLSETWRLEEAERIYRESCEVLLNTLGLEHPTTLDAMNDLGDLLGQRGKYKEAETLARQVLAGKEKVLGVDDPSTLATLYNLADALDGQGKHAEAESIFRDTLERMRVALGDDHLYTLYAMHGLAQSLFNIGKYADAEGLLQEALERRRNILGAGDPDTQETLELLASLLEKLGRAEEAEGLRKESRQAREGRNSESL